MIYVVPAIALAILLLALAATRRRLDKTVGGVGKAAEEEAGRLWRRVEWLGRDTDDRLSADRVELQQRAMQIRNLQKRVKRVEEYLYLEARDAFKDGDGEDRGKA